MSLDKMGTTRSKHFTPAYRGEGQWLRNSGP